MERGARGTLVRVVAVGKIQLTGSAQGGGGGAVKFCNDEFFFLGPFVSPVNVS